MPASPSHVSEITRARLLAAATTLFARKGFDGVSVKELAEEAGVNVSLVSYHFGGKEQLFRACLEQFGQERLTLAQRVLQPPRTLEELHLRLRMFLEELLAAHLDNRDAAELVHRECEMGKAIAPEVFRNTFFKIFETMIEFFRAAREARIIRPEIEPLIVSQLVFGSIKQVIRSEAASQQYFGLSIVDEMHRRRVVDHILQCCVFGITGADGFTGTSIEKGSNA